MSGENPLEDPAPLEALSDGSAMATSSEPPPRLETSIPYGQIVEASTSSTPEKQHRPLLALSQRLRGLFNFNPRATDFERLLKKLEEQFRVLDFAYARYARKAPTPSENDEKYDARDDPKHPINTNSKKLITDIHYAGRHATDPSIVRLSTLLIDHDRFGCIVEMWLNDNQISDEGASAIASYLELPSCRLAELWLGRNRIGPSGAESIATAISNSGNDGKLTCLGLHLNPIGNRGASALTRMLKENHTLTTVDVHGCLRYEKRDGDDDPGIAEQYAGGCGCKVITPYDGNEYLAQVIANGAIVGAGFVTDRKLVDAIQSFAAFNRRNPTRKQVIRGMESLRKQDDGETCDAENEGEGKDASTFLSELSGRAANERLTNAEKSMWKECEWQRL